MLPLPDELETLARRRAGAKLGWYAHAAIYVLMNAGWLLTSQWGWGHRPWSPYPALGWGLGLVLHGVSVFVLAPGSGLRERMIEREREKLRRQNPPGP